MATPTPAQQAAAKNPPAQPTASATISNSKPAVKEESADAVKEELTDDEKEALAKFRADKASSQEKDATKSMVNTSKTEGEATVKIRGLRDEHATVGGKKYIIKAKETQTVPIGVCMILQNAGVAIRIS